MLFQCIRTGMCLRPPPGVLHHAHRRQLCIRYCAEPSHPVLQPTYPTRTGQAAHQGAALREAAAAADAAAAAAKHVAAQHAVLALRRRLCRRAVTLATLGQILAGAAAAVGLDALATSPDPDPVMAGMPGGPQRPASHAAHALADDASSLSGVPGCPAASHRQGCEGLPPGPGPVMPALAPEQLPSVLHALLARHAAAAAQLRGHAAAADARAAELARELQELRVADTQARASAASADARAAGRAREVEELRAAETQTRAAVAAAEACSSRLTGELEELWAAQTLARASAATAEEAASARERAAADNAAVAAACIRELQARLSVVSASAIVARQVSA